MDDEIGMYTDIVILAILDNHPQHGYEIKRNVEHVLGGYVLNNKSLYPALKRFEEMGAVQREVVRQQGKPDRHIYQLTDRGIEVLQALLRDYTSDILANESEFLVRLAFCQLLEPAERKALLETRSAVLEQQLTHLKALFTAHSDVLNSYARQILVFKEQKLEQEIQWIAGMARDIRRDKE